MIWGPSRQCGDNRDDVGTTWVGTTGMTGTTWGRFGGYGDDGDDVGTTWG